MDLFKKVNPQNLNELIFYKKEIKDAIEWITNYKNNIDRSKKVLLFIGDTGCGKTTIAHFFLKKFEYKIIELNSGDIRTQKKIGDFLHKTLGFNNVLDMFYDKKKPIGLILDEIETFTQSNDKGGLGEFIQILKDNIKYEKNKKKDDEIKGKVKKNDKNKINMNNFIFIENPIICTCMNINDKKINELKTFSHVINLSPIKFESYNLFVNSIKKNLKLSIDIKKDLLKKIVKECENDIRKFIQSLENIFLYHANSSNEKSNEIDDTVFDKIKNLNDTTKNDIQLVDAVKLFLNENINLKKLDLLFYLDPYHLPFTVYHNLINFLSNTTLKNIDKFEIYSAFLESLSQFDKTSNLLYDNNDWGTIDNSLKLHGFYQPNYILHNIKFKVKKEIDIEFTNIHNKTSQMLVNKKLISSAKSSLNKKYTSLNNIILNCELLFIFFNNFRDLILNNKFDNLHKHYLIKYMNYYKIDYNNLENILKIEKINKDEDKRKKNITVLLKEKIIEHLDITLKN